MIKIKVNYNKKYITDFKITGHANFDDYGKDIVCAAVSSIVITSVNLALSFNEDIIEYTNSEGLIDVNIKSNNDIINKVFINMIDMLKDLEKQYSKNIKFI